MQVRQQKVKTKFNYMSVVTTLDVKTCELYMSCPKLIGAAVRGRPAMVEMSSTDDIC